MEQTRPPLSSTREVTSMSFAHSESNGVSCTLVRAKASLKGLTMVAFASGAAGVGGSHDAKWAEIRY